MPKSLAFRLNDSGDPSGADDRAAEVISADFFGAEFLGQRYFLSPSYGQAVQDAIGYNHLRWPGHHPELTTTVDHDGLPETPDEVIQEYGLTFPDFVNPAYTRHDGSAREGLSDMLGFAVENDLSFALVAPTARYAQMAMDGGGTPEAIAAAAAAAAADMEDFMTRLFAGDFGALPRKFTIELGSEYYDTDVWKSATAAVDLDGDGMADPLTGDPGALPGAFGAIFAAMAAKIGEVEALNGHSLTVDGITQTADIGVAVQMGRFQEDAGDSQHRGAYSDNLAFIEAFADHGQAAFDAVDSVIWHRYVTRWGGIENGIWDPIREDENGNAMTVGDVVAKWEAAAGRELDLLAGFSSPSLSNSKQKMEHGAPSLSYILQQTTGLMAEGADMGTLFGIGSGQHGSYAYQDNVFLGGMLWGLMAESLPGARVVETFHGSGRGYRDNTSPLDYGSDGRATGHRNDGTVNRYVFENDDQVIVFLVAKDFGSVGDHAGETLAYDLSFDIDLAFASAVRLRATGEEFVADSGRAIGVFGALSDETDVAVRNTLAGSDLSVRFTRDYELMRLTLDKVLYGTGGDDVFDGFTTADKILGQAGDDLLRGHDGDDTLKGGDGHDTLEGGAGRDVYIGNLGRDRVDYSAAETWIAVDLATSDGTGGATLGERFHSIEEIIGSAHDDILLGNGAKNLFVGSAGNDRLDGADNRDTLSGGDGDDTLQGGRGRDQLEGGDGVDDIRGGGGADRLFGDAGDDRLAGGASNDTLEGGAGDDWLEGGSDADIFRFADGHGADTIADFAARSDSERIDLSGITGVTGFGELQASGALVQEGQNLRILTGEDSSILLLDTALSDLNAADFLF